jgi:hypothetical protein
MEAVTVANPPKHLIERTGARIPGFRVVDRQLGSYKLSNTCSEELSKSELVATARPGHFTEPNKNPLYREAKIGIARFKDEQPASRRHHAES